MQFRRSSQWIIQYRAFAHPKFDSKLRSNTSCVRTYSGYRLSNFWTPTGGLTPSEESQDDSNSLLARAGFVRQSHAGIFQFLPLGLRVQEKIERLLDKHMRALGASKVSLSSFSSEELWRKSGRLQGDRSELFQVEDRKGSRFLLAPTHEEEITSLIANSVHSYKDLPLRLYQITRKYRDEPRPRQGLLRTREFLMKDLYTFDFGKANALKTYEDVKSAYASFFDEFKVPYLTAEADSGNIGGDLSHEYHLTSSKGEDNVYTCETCKFSINEEMLKDDNSLTRDMQSCKCPKCNARMQAVTSIELGHTFYLGTKYSSPLRAFVDTPEQVSQPHSSAANSALDRRSVPIEMGCHGIGVSRIIAGMADALADSRGLNWPRVIAPFEVSLLHAPTKYADAEFVLGTLNSEGLLDTIIDDREKSLVWKMKDADLIGYPILVIIGKAWDKAQKCEVQCRRLNRRDYVPITSLSQTIKDMLSQL